MDFKALASKKYNEAITLIKDLVSFKSVLEQYSPNSEAPFGIENKKALDFILAYAQNDGFIIKNIDNYAGHIELKFNDDYETIGILAHLDVVPVTNQIWTTDPFFATVVDDKIYGRGTTDDKGPLVCAYLAMKLIKENNLKLNKNIRLICGCDEESGSRCLEHYFKYEKMPELGFSPDAEFPVIYGEKAMASIDLKLKKDDIILDINAGERYNIVPPLAKMKLKINLDKEFDEFLKDNNYEGYIEDGYYCIKGRSAHAMVPQNGQNPIFMLMDFLNKYHKTNISNYFEKYLNYDYFAKKININIKDEDMLDLTENVAIIKTYDDYIKVGINYRIPVDNYVNTIVEAFSNTEALAVDVVSESSRHFVDKNSHLVTSLMKAYQEISNDYESKPFTIGGGTYSKFINNCVAFGPVFPNREDVCHIANEYFNLEDMVNSIAIYAKAIYELGK